MLRAIGFKRSAVALGLLLETSFIAILGIVSASPRSPTLLQPVRQREFSTIDLALIIPWWQVLLVAGFAYGASFLMTVIPRARRRHRHRRSPALRVEGSGAEGQGQGRGQGQGSRFGRWWVDSRPA